MLTRLTEVGKAILFSMLVVVLALAAVAGLIRVLDLPDGLRSSALST
jgi:hypothetical protein